MKIIFVFASVFCLNCWASTVNGRIQGKVVDDTGRPVGGARVVIARALPPDAPHVAAPPVITGPLAATAAADAAGTFEIDAIRAGTYVACAQSAAPGLLDPCHWAKSAPEFTVVAGQILAGVKVTMARGAVISIHVNDPLGLLAAATGPIDFACQFHVVTGKGLHYNANIQARAAGSRDHAITVPFGTPVNLQAISPHLILTDQAGKTLPAAATAVPIPAAANPPTIVYTVTGKK